MKQKTKAKIEIQLIKWFRKLFNYTPYIQPYKIEERKIQLIKIDKCLSKKEKELLDNVENNFKQIIEDDISVNMAKAMLKMGAIKIEYSFKEDGSIRLEAKTYVPEKL
jgi:hypothetical protein